MTKSAWTNVLTGIADSNADFDTLINNLVDSVSAFGENIITSNRNSYYKG